MTRVLKLTSTLCLLLAFTACDARTDKTDGGGVILSITEFDNFPIGFSANGIANGPGSVSSGDLTITNIPKNPANTSQLMDVEMQSYEVRCTRGDTGTRVPPPYVRGVFGVAPVGGTVDYTGLPLMDLEQITNRPIADLLFENGGHDTETGETRILLNCAIRFFGRTISGDEVETAPGNFALTVTQ